MTAAISPRRVPRGKARGRLSRLEKHNTSQPPAEGGVPSADCLHRRIRKKYIFSLRAGNNYVVEHAKRYPSFLRAITRKESFDRLVERYLEDGRIACSSIIEIFEDIFDYPIPYTLELNSLILQTTALR